METVAVEMLAEDGPLSPTRLRCVSAIPQFRRSRLKHVHVQNADGVSLYEFAPEARLVTFLATSERLSLESVGLSFVPCFVSQSLVHLRELDLSWNALELFGFSPGCVRSLPSLRALRLDGNSLRSLAGLARETQHMTRLEILSANFNSNFTVPWAGPTPNRTWFWTLRT